MTSQNSHYLPKATYLVDTFLATPHKKPLLTILGPTATGKSDLAVALAIHIKNKHNINCEIISADSRQIYKHLNIGTGKITVEEMQNIPHHMLDICDPSTVYTVADYQNDATKIIEEIFSRNNLPIIVGGTGQYIDAVIYKQELPPVPPNPELRKELEEKSIEELLEQFETLNKSQPHQVDLKNKRRIIRAIEILTELGHIPQIDFDNREKKHDSIVIGIDTDDATLKNRIRTRLEKRIEIGMIKESEDLLNRNILTKERMHTLGLEYSYIADLLDKKIDIDEFNETLFFAIWHYAKRQRTWFSKNPNVIWILAN